jgi:hypothetical protein
MNSRGRMKVVEIGGQTVQAFVPAPLPIQWPRDVVCREILELHERARISMEQLESTAQAAGQWCPVVLQRKQAVLATRPRDATSNISDLLIQDASGAAPKRSTEPQAESFVSALEYARYELARPRATVAFGIICGAHKRLMQDVNLPLKNKGVLRSSLTWGPGKHAGNAGYIPPPGEEVADAVAALDKWLKRTHNLPPLVYIAFAHAQFLLIQPFSTANDAMAELLVLLLLERFNLPAFRLLDLGRAFSRHREILDTRLVAIRSEGDWQGRVNFFLECVLETAEDGVTTVLRLAIKIDQDRTRLLADSTAKLPAIRLFERLLVQPVVSLKAATSSLSTTKPTAKCAIDLLLQTGILKEITGRRRGRVYAYQDFLDILGGETS